MAPKGEEQHDVLYAPLPPSPQPQNYVVLPVYVPFSLRLKWNSRLLAAAAILLLLPAAFYILWPSDPTIQIVRLKLNNFHVNTSPRLSLDLSLSLTLKVLNRDVYSMDYNSMNVSIAYRGRILGFVITNEGLVRPKTASYVDADLELEDVGVFSDVIFLVRDLAKGSIPFDTVSVVTGRLGLLFVGIPLKAKVSCELSVNTRNQTIIRQNCYSEQIVALSKSNHLNVMCSEEYFNCAKAGGAYLKDQFLQMQCFTNLSMLLASCCACCTMIASVTVAASKLELRAGLGESEIWIKPYSGRHISAPFFDERVF
ncbi:hypothetical protein RJ641_020019 [Dillenia turbinata]|uniref:Late embryogenesis abundant protein LEA-2 subgroup domain-containing protein n=1 Tax=Dillenia turbinata TaxID=194707 RepID=A0AAN8UQQ7_9MAGN